MGNESIRWFSRTRLRYSVKSRKNEYFFEVVQMASFAPEGSRALSRLEIWTLCMRMQVDLLGGISALVKAEAFCPIFTGAGFSADLRNSK